ncbi:MAG: glucuronate isomerase, partial [Kiritimatiellia bacterium]|nr:glucuronate isomerase [Kiritimatiellia bacterium]
EACRGVVTVMQSLGLNPRAPSLDEARAYFAEQSLEQRVDRAFERAGLTSVYMTNDPMDPEERPAWEKGFRRDPRFHGVLRLDSALMNWPEPVPRLRALGYAVEEALSGKTIEEIRRYLRDWCARFEARYVAISLPPSFRYPAVESPLTNLMIKAVFPVAEELGIPVAMMIGVKKLVNPALRLAGDAVGKAEIETVEALARDFPRIRFLVTLLSRENQHELCIAARKFSNLLVFGCWWFLNNPTFIREMTAMRLELLGLSFIPQHSDARILEQLIYKWAHSRELIGQVLAAKVEELSRAGWTPTPEEIRRDAARLLDGATLAR